MDKFSSSIDYEFDSPNRVHTIWESKGKGSGPSGRWITYYAEGNKVRGKKFISTTKGNAIKIHRKLAERLHRIKHAHHKETR